MSNDHRILGRTPVEFLAEVGDSYFKDGRNIRGKIIVEVLKETADLSFAERKEVIRQMYQEASAQYMGIDTSQKIRYEVLKWVWSKFKEA